MQIFALAEEDDLGQPIWRRLDFLYDLSAVADTSPPASAAQRQGAAERGRFAGRVVASAALAARKIDADEVIIVGMPGVLHALRPYLRFLDRDGLETAHVCMDMDRLAAAAARRLPALGGATRAFALAPAPDSVPEAA